MSLKRNALQLQLRGEGQVIRLTGQLQRRYVFLNLKPYYSPTNSYLQIDSPVGATVACRSTLTLDVSYITTTQPPVNNFNYVYQVPASASRVHWAHSMGP